MLTLLHSLLVCSERSFLPLVVVRHFAQLVRLPHHVVQQRIERQEGRIGRLRRVERLCQQRLLARRAESLARGQWRGDSGSTYRRCNSRAIHWRCDPRCIPRGRNPRCIRRRDSSTHPHGRNPSIHLNRRRPSLRGRLHPLRVHEGMVGRQGKAIAAVLPLDSPLRSRHRRFLVLRGLPHRLHQLLLPLLFGDGPSGSPSASAAGSDTRSPQQLLQRSLAPQRALAREHRRARRLRVCRQLHALLLTSALRPPVAAAGRCPRAPPRSADTASGSGCAAGRTPLTAVRSAPSRSARDSPSVRAAAAPTTSHGTREATSSASVACRSRSSRSML